MAANKKLIRTDLLYPELSYQVQGCFFAVYNTLGFGHKEAAYHRALEEELRLRNIQFGSRQALSVMYHSRKIADYIPDLVIDNKIR